MMLWLFWGCREKIQLLPSWLRRPSHSHCILRRCLEREPGRMSSACLEFGWAHSAASGTAFHLPGMSAVFTKERDSASSPGLRPSPEDPSSAPSPLRVGHSQVLDSWPFGLEFSELGLTHLPSISLGKKEPREAACIHLSDLSHPWCLWDFICSPISVPNWCPSLKCPLHEARHSWSSLLCLPSIT